MYGYDEVKELSLKIIEKLNNVDIKCTVLTKGVLPIELTKYSHKNEYGIGKRQKAGRNAPHRG